MNYIKVFPSFIIDQSFKNYNCYFKAKAILGISLIIKERFSYQKG